MRLFFVSILGEPGSYDPSVYKEAPGGDNECRWFMEDFAYLEGVEILGARVSHGDPLPAPESADAFILGGSYNSVHDDFPWQREVLAWFDHVKDAERPLLGICGGHQLMGLYFKAEVGPVPAAPIAGTEAVALTDKGRHSPLFAGLSDIPAFHFANYEHVLQRPAGAEILARHEHIPVAALSFSDRWFSVQFHPEAQAESLAMSWRPTHPDFAAAYTENGLGKRLIENYLAIAKAL